MLAYIRCGKTSGTYAHSYLQNPNVAKGMWSTRERGEVNGFLCDIEIKLTEELKLYLLYFCDKLGSRQTLATNAFSNLPMKHQTVEESDC